MSRYDVWQATKVQQVNGQKVATFGAVLCQDISLTEARKKADNKAGLFVVEHISSNEWKVHYE